MGHEQTAGEGAGFDKGTPRLSPRPYEAHRRGGVETRGQSGSGGVAEAIAAYDAVLPDLVGRLDAVRSGRERLGE